MRIGELAAHLGTTTRALRFYEARGLLAAGRSVNGYREYDEHDARLVREIISLRAAGFSVEETRPFVECLRSGHATGDSCPDSIAVYQRKLAEVEECLGRLEALRESLRGKLTEARMQRNQHPCMVDPEEP